MSETRKPVFRDDTYPEILSKIRAGAMSDVEMQRRFRSPLFRLWLRFVLQSRRACDER